MRQPEIVQACDFTVGQGCTCLGGGLDRFRGRPVFACWRDPLSQNNQG